MGRRDDDADQDEVCGEADESWCGGTQGAHAVTRLSPTFVSPSGFHHIWDGCFGLPAHDEKVGGFADSFYLWLGSKSVLWGMG